MPVMLANQYPELLLNLYDADPPLFIPHTADCRVCI